MGGCAEEDRVIFYAYMLRKALILIFVLTICGCYSIKIDKQVAGLDPVEMRQNFFFWGLVGDNEINLAEECPRGVSAFNEKATFGNMIVTLLTVGLYSPRTVIINCAT